MGHIGAGGDGDMLLLACALILCRYVNNAVGVYIKGNLDLRNAAGCGSDSVKGEATQGRVACRHISLALKHMDLN